MATDTASSDGGIVDRIRSAGLGPQLVILGLVLFVLPEPITSTLGVVVVLAGLVIWFLG